jgi:DMSO reductase anchor subunit
MHPAYSVIFFTTAAGAGYGLLALLGLTAAFGFEEPTLPFRLVSVGLALALIVSGLLSSTAHLGRPERAWRALSQWRTSWLSREGVAALATFVPAGIFAIGWVVLGLENWWVAAAGILAAFGSVVTICTTAMIYASLKPIPRWSSRYTLPNYLVLSAMTGAVLFDALLATLEQARASVAILAAVLALGGWALKRATWRYNDTLGPATTLNSATGLAGGTVRSIEWPHTAENYLLKDMGFVIARKHALKLRLIAQALAFVVPVILLVAGLAAPAWAAAALSVLAAISQLSGVLVERWLFFAEAKHAVALYYGR